MVATLARRLIRGWDSGRAAPSVLFADQPGLELDLERLRDQPGGVAIRQATTASPKLRKLDHEDNLRLTGQHAAYRNDQLQAYQQRRWDTHQADAFGNIMQAAVAGLSTTQLQALANHLAAMPAPAPSHLPATHGPGQRQAIIDDLDADRRPGGAAAHSTGSLRPGAGQALDHEPYHRTRP